MIVDIPYGKNHQTLHIDDARVNAVLTPQHIGVTDISESDIVKHALESPIKSPRLSALARNKQKIVVITSDHTRPVPSKITMPLLLQEIRKGNKNAVITILIATGLHRKTTEAELRDKFGDEIVDKEKIVVHEARDTKHLTSFGELPSGGELRLNSLVDEADLVVAEGFVEPHFFAGFSGGRKAILPGVAGEKTVLWNHNARFIASKNAHQGSLKNNPIHEDMLFAAKKVNLAFILNVLLSHDKHIVSAVAGDMESAHEAGCNLSRKLTTVDKVQSDIAITSNGGYPLDQNIYQSVKGLTAAEACVGPGGIIIMCSEASDGTGGDSFYHWLADRESAAAVAEEIYNTPPDQTVPDQWEAQILARIMAKHEIVFVTGDQNRACVEEMHFTWAPTVDDALAYATTKLGDNASVTIIPDGVGVIVNDV